MDNHNFVLPFRLVCLICTGALLFYCSIKYVKNESTSLVDFQTYHNEKKDIYPSFTMCFGIIDEQDELYDKKRLKEIYNIENVTKYINFLAGEEWDEELLTVDYDDVTIDLKDYVKTVILRVNSSYSDPIYKWNNNDTNKNVSKSIPKTSAQRKDSFPFYTSFRQAKNKCFTVDFSTETFPEMNGHLISTFEVIFKDLKLPNVIIGYFLHYPKQFIRSPSLDLEWRTKIGIITGDTKVFWIDNLDVIRRRNTPNTPCNMEWQNDDEIIRKQIVNDVGCKPPHWKINDDYPICNNKIAMKKTNILKWDVPDTAFLKSFKQPCQQVQSISFTPHVVRRINESEEPFPYLWLIFKSTTYKEIQHIRSFSAESLVGNMGGYVGLFLGFAIWQVPEAIQFLVIKLSPRT